MCLIHVYDIKIAAVAVAGEATRGVPNCQEKTMKAAIVSEPGSGPGFGEFPIAVPSGDEYRIKLSASAVSHLTKGHASGRHYSAGGQYPFIAGIDGIGKLEDGRRVYFALPRAPYGTLAEYTVIPRAFCVPVPEELDDLTAAAIANPGIASWMALTERARLKPGETVLVNGATGTSGRLAVQIARHLGAGKVIATGRNPAALSTLETLGADGVIRRNSCSASISSSTFCGASRRNAC